MARKVLTLVYYGLRDGEIRCLAQADGSVRLGHDQAASSTIGMTHAQRAVAELIEPNLAVANDPIMRTNRREYMPRQPSLTASLHSHPRDP